jgi:methylenetetrahydrofolate dehydrogenase (NADP+)/methenyltetrahydrofolate cyclohydrolase
LQHYEIPLAGTHAVVIGRSPVVGLPLALLLLDSNATVTVCHSRTPNLAEVSRQADLLCVAVGRQGLVGPDFVKPGAVVLDFGTHPLPEGGMAGDVQTEAVAHVASALTPVPGGTGPTTVAVLAEQTLRAAEHHQRRRA